MESSEGFPPIVRSDARLLVLGSLPGQKSLAVEQYYGHPQNAFWPIMKDLFGIEGEYVERCAGLIDNKLALWDVLRASVRPGSLDADIQLETAAANDFGLFLNAHANIEKIVFNGKKAEQLFRTLVPEELHQHLQLTYPLMLPLDDYSLLISDMLIRIKKKE